MGKNKWPNTAKAEAMEIEMTLKYLARFEGFSNLKIVQKRERPDYEIFNGYDSGLIGVELSSVYISDRSVPDEHMKRGWHMFEPDPERIEEYLRRIEQAIKSKMAKAQTGYDLYQTMILSLYINEFDSIFIEEEEWKSWEASNRSLIDDLTPFTHVLLHSLADDDAFLLF